MVGLLSQRFNCLRSLDILIQKKKDFQISQFLKLLGTGSILAVTDLVIHFHQELIDQLSLKMNFQRFTMGNRL